MTSNQGQIAAMLPGLVFERALVPRYNIAPTQEIAAVLNEAADRVALVRWGMIPSWAKEPAIGARMINARAETLHEKPSYKRPLQRQRCLILADGFYEWQKVPDKKGKIPHYIRLKSGEPFAFAGLWDRWRAPDGEIVTTATIITTTPNALLARLHERMPVILPPQCYALWLSPQEVAPEKLRALLTPYPADAMNACSVSTQINDPGFDDPACITPVGEEALPGP